MRRWEPTATPGVGRLIVVEQKEERPWRSRIGGDDTAWEPPRTRSTGCPIDCCNRLVLVTWRDAWFDFDEVDPEDARSDYLVTTVGFPRDRASSSSRSPRRSSPTATGTGPSRTSPSVVGSVTALREHDEPIADVGPH